MSLSTAQKIGRLAELYVEARLTKLEWLCGNFNVSVGNAGAWDLFAKKAGKTRVLRVKGSSTSDVTWASPAGPQSPLPDWVPEDTTDWTAIVVDLPSDYNIAPSQEPRTYLLPTTELVKYLQGAGLNPDWTLLHLYFKAPSRKVNIDGQYGLDKKFESRLNNWEMEA